VKTARLLYRKFRQDDFEYYFQLTGNKEVMKMITGKPSSFESSKKNFAEILALNYPNENTGYYFVSDKQNDTFIGLGKVVFSKTNEIEIGYMLLPGFWGNGYGKEISDKMVEIAKRVPSVNTVMAVIDPENLASKKILLKSGFKLNEVCKYQGLPAEIYRRHFS
jgi:hypothetical protein